jgi:hypothetical protein
MESHLRKFVFSDMSETRSRGIQVKCLANLIIPLTESNRNEFCLSAAARTLSCFRDIVHFRYWRRMCWYSTLGRLRAMVMAPLVLQIFQRQTHCCTDIKMTVSYHIRIRDKSVFLTTRLGRGEVYTGAVKPTGCTACIVYCELTASTCFDHYLLIFRTKVAANRHNVHAKYQLLFVHRLLKMSK